MQLETLIGLVCNVWESFEGRFYFQKSFGFDCVDEPGGRVVGTVGKDPAAYFLRKLGREDVWPYQDHADHWDLDTLLDMVEALYDLVAKPEKPWYHDYYQCGWHHKSFDEGTGRSEYRSEINEVLSRAEPPFELTVSGEVMETGPPGLGRLLGADAPEGTDDEVVMKIDDAITRFRARHGRLEEKRVALRELADVLELLREDAKKHLLTKDERGLFQLANGFAIRHHNQQQQGQYDKGVWLPWAFYVYLATIHALLRVRARE